MNESRQVVSFSAFESTCTRMERNNKRLFVLCIVLLIALLATNAAWIWYESQYETVSYEQEVQHDAEENGDNTFI